MAPAHPIAMIQNRAYYVDQKIGAFVQVDKPRNLIAFSAVQIKNSQLYYWYDTKEKRICEEPPWDRDDRPATMKQIPITLPPEIRSSDIFRNTAIRNARSTLIQAAIAKTKTIFKKNKLR